MLEKFCGVKSFVWFAGGENESLSTTL